MGFFNLPALFNWSFIMILSSYKKHDNGTRLSGTVKDIGWQCPSYSLVLQLFHVDVIKVTMISILIASMVNFTVSEKAHADSVIRVLKL